MTYRIPKFIDEAYINLFSIPVNSSIIVRQQDRSSRRYQQCKLTRTAGPEVAVGCRDFAGSHFNLKINLDDFSIGFPDDDGDILWDEILMGVVYRFTIDILQRDVYDPEYLITRSAVALRDTK